MSYQDELSSYNGNGKVRAKVNANPYNKAKYANPESADISAPLKGYTLDTNVVVFTVKNANASKGVFALLPATDYQPTTDGHLLSGRFKAGDPMGVTSELMDDGSNLTQLQRFYRLMDSGQVPIINNVRIITTAELAQNPYSILTKRINAATGAPASGKVPFLKFVNPRNFQAGYYDPIPFNMAADRFNLAEIPVAESSTMTVMMEFSTGVQNPADDAQKYALTRR